RPAPGVHGQPLILRRKYPGSEISRQRSKVMGAQRFGPSIPGSSSGICLSLHPEGLGVAGWVLIGMARLLTGTGLGCLFLITYPRVSREALVELCSSPSHT